MSVIDQPFSTGLSDAERERLALLLEECGEVQQIIGKILRHGYESCDPTKQGSPTNRMLLENELGDLQMAFGYMVRVGDLNFHAINAAHRRKEREAFRWFHFQRIHPVGCAACDRGDFQLGHHDDCPNKPS